MPVTPTAYEIAFQQVLDALGAGSKQVYSPSIGLPSDDAAYDDEVASIAARLRAHVLLRRQVNDQINALTTKVATPLAGTEFTILPLAARTTLTSFGPFVNPGYKGLTLVLHITVSAAGTGGLAIRLQGNSYAGGELLQPVSYNLGADTTAQTTVANFFYTWYPDIGAAAGDMTANRSIELPRSWGGFITVGDATSYTYSLNAQYLP